MDSLLQDIRYGVRSLLRTPTFTIAAIATLALGIGANTAIFSVVDGVLLRPAPVADIDRVMMVWETDRRGGTAREPASLPDFLDFQQRSRAFSELAAFTGVEMNVTGEGADPVRVAALGVTHEFLPLLGVAPLAGRLLEDAETRPNGPRGAVISEDLWEQRFSRDTAVIGASIRLNDVEWSVVGVLPRTADFGVLQVLGAADYGRGFAQRGGRTRVDVWVGLRADAASLPRSTHPILVVGRLTDGASAAQAQQELAAVMTDLEAQYPENSGRGVNVAPLADVVFGPVRPALLTLLGAVVLVLLVACANVANLLLVRATAREREVTIRVALGAQGRRLTQQFLIEGALLTSAGAGLGLLLAATTVDALKALAPANLPRVDHVTLDMRVLLATMIASIVVAATFGLLPSLHARGWRLQGALRRSSGRGASSAREHTRLRSTLIVSELAMAAMLMVGAGLLIQSLWRLQQVDLGFNTDGVLKAEYQLPATRYPRNFAVYPRWPEVQRFNSELASRLGTLPRVSGVTLAAYHPLNAGSISSIRVVGREAEAADWPEPAIRMVGDNYFDVMGVAVRAGRAFTPGDDADAPPVVVINDAARARFFAGRDPLGAQINLWGANRTIVGVVANERFRGASEDVAPAVYPPITQTPPAGGAYSVLVRGPGDVNAYAQSIRSAVRDLDALLPVFGIEPLSVTFGASVAQQRFTMLVLGLFAVVALSLAAVGVHGVLSYSVSQRVPEIGIRMALGANPASVRSFVVGQGARLIALGLALGLGGALALTQLLGTLLYGVGPRDPLTFAAVAAALAVTALLACYLPARRAARVEPVWALRVE